MSKVGIVILVWIFSCLVIGLGGGYLIGHMVGGLLISISTTLVWWYFLPSFATDELFGRDDAEQARIAEIISGISTSEHVDDPLWRKRGLRIRERWETRVTSLQAEGIEEAGLLPAYRSTVAGFFDEIDLHRAERFAQMPASQLLRVFDTTRYSFQEFCRAVGH